MRIEDILRLFRFGGFYAMLKSGVDIVGFLEMIGTSQKVLDYMRSVTVLLLIEDQG